MSTLANDLASVSIEDRPRPTTSWTTLNIALSSPFSENMAKDNKTWLSALKQTYARMAGALVE
jgi:hypothetical protein